MPFFEQYVEIFPNVIFYVDPCMTARKTFIRIESIKLLEKFSFFYLLHPLELHLY